MIDAITILVFKFKVQINFTAKQSGTVLSESILDRRFLYRGEPEIKLLQSDLLHRDLPRNLGFLRLDFVHNNDKHIRPFSDTHFVV